jgi:hypothetical protein
MISIWAYYEIINVGFQSADMLIIPGYLPSRLKKICCKSKIKPAEKIGFAFQSIVYEQ